MLQPTSCNELGYLIRTGFAQWDKLGQVYTKETENLILFNCKTQAQYEGRWNWFERASRGLIFTKTGNLAALPFPKFFNWGEDGKTTSAPVVEAIEKIDGSLGILYYDEDWKIATRGSFDGEQAVWATEFLHRNYPKFCDTWRNDVTLLFEIIYPRNRIVVDYGEREDLVLLGARHLISRCDFLFTQSVTEWATRYGFTTPKVHRSIITPDEAIEYVKGFGYNREGIVLRFADGSRFKFKGSEYRRIHWLIHNLSEKNIRAVMYEGELGDLIATLPPEFRTDVEKIRDQTLSEIDAIKRRVDRAFTEAPTGGTRKEFALWVKRHTPALAHYLFAKLDGKEIDRLVYNVEYNIR